MLLLQRLPKLCHLRSLRTHTRLVTCTTSKSSIFCNMCRTNIANNVRNLSYTPSLNNSKDEISKEEKKFGEWMLAVGDRRSRDFLKLSKVNLSALVALTGCAGYAVAPGSFELSKFMLTFLGTFLCSASANSLNQFREVPYDCQMPRTLDRPLVTGSLRPESAIYFATVSGIAGFTLLWSTVNLETASLGLANLVLYAWAYTTSKREGVVNTWIGAVVGAIPPLMGWVAKTGCAGMTIGAFILPLILFSWQFPHFNALSWKYRPDYSRAGYRMMSVMNPDLCRRVALRHSVLQVALCFAAYYFLLPYTFFLVPAVLLNLKPVYYSWEFYNNSSQSSADKLFYSTIFTLPFFMFLIFFWGIWKEVDWDKLFI